MKNKVILSEKPKIIVYSMRNYVQIYVDMLSIDHDLNDGAVKILFQKFWKYIVDHPRYRKIANQFFSANQCGGFIIVLKADKDEMLEEINDIVLDKQNWIKLRG